MAWFPDFVVDRVLDYDPGKYDGVFLDDTWEKISFLNASIPSPIDLNRDGTAETSTALDAAWTSGTQTMVDAIRARVGNQYIVMGNGQRIVVVPRNNPVNAFTMGGIARDAGLSVEQFRDLL